MSALAGEPVHGHLVVPVVRRLIADPGRNWAEVRDDLGLPGHARDAPGLGEQVSGADHHLAWDTGPVRALPADQFRLHPDHVQTGLGQPLGDVLTPHAHPDHHDIGVLRHDWPPWSALPGD